MLLLKVTPVFAKMFADFGSALPGPTQVVVDMSEWLQHYILHLIVGIIAVVVAFTAFYRNPRGREFFDKVILHVPLIGDVLRKVAVARFTRTLGTMISSGVPILDALDVTAKTAGNRTIEEGIYYVRAKISEGKNIAGPLADTKVFPSMVVQMIGVGEATGAMDQMLAKIADFYDDEVDTAVADLTSLIEPIMMVFLGGVCGGFLIAMYLPDLHDRRVPSSSVPTGEALRVRLLWLTLFRTVLAASLLFVLVFQSSLRARAEPPEPPGATEYVAFALLAMVFVVTLVTGLMLRASEVRRSAGWTHVLFDVALSTIVVLVTGGAESPFAFLFLLAIIGAAILLGRSGAMSAVIGAMVAMVVITTRPWEPDASWIPFDLATHLAAQGLIGLLSAYAAEQILRSEAGQSASEEDLKRLTVLHRQIVTALPAGVLTCDRRGRTTFINPAAQAMLGAEPSPALIDRLLSGARDVRRHEVRVQTHRGERTLGLSRTALPEEGGTLVVFQDLTELRRLEAELERIDHLASLGRVSAQLAHEIRNPLAAMRGAAQMLEADAGPQARLAGLIVREADRLAALVDASLQLARPPPPSLALVGVHHVVAETVDMLRSDPSIGCDRGGPEGRSGERRRRPVEAGDHQPLAQRGLGGENGGANQSANHGDRRAGTRSTSGTARGP